MFIKIFIKNRQRLRVKFNFNKSELSINEDLNFLSVEIFFETGFDKIDLFEI